MAGSKVKISFYNNNVKINTHNCSTDDMKIDFQEAIPTIIDTSIHVLDHLVWPLASKIHKPSAKIYQIMDPRYECNYS